MFRAEGKGSVVGGSEVFQDPHDNPVKAVPCYRCDTHFIGS